uniref:Uncharacterized protein n=1 Tax=Setaria viridis TaxID=4556 RepID=A0A4U6VQA8_SETVI|nr:hypothetical protein SEVIR_2G140800v2 [Setaria viridis]
MMDGRERPKACSGRKLEAQAWIWAFGMHGRHDESDGHIFPRSPAEGSNGCDVAALPPPTGGGAPRLAQLHLTRWGVHLCGGHSGE